MRPTDPRELLYPVLPPETYQRLGITPPRPPQVYGSGGPVSSAGTPYLTGRAFTRTVAAPGQDVPAPPAPAAAPSPSAPPAPSGPPPPSAPDPSDLQRAVTPNPLPPPPMPYVPVEPPRKDRAVWIVAGATAVIIAIIIGAAWIIIAGRGPDDEQQVRDAIAAETKALNERDLDALVAARCAADSQQLRLEFTPETFAAQVDMMVGPSGRWEVTVGKVSVDGAAGTATAEETTVPVGSQVAMSQKSTAMLRKESGTWKVCVSSSSVR